MALLPVAEFGNSLFENTGPQRVAFAGTAVPDVGAEVVVRGAADVAAGEDVVVDGVVLS
ncbi:hypothetical protein ACFRFQ_15750 [Rhodococcus sp. NPDC056743]|uniref:hypothetical protein n=1 Tax=Rhodococcus sp. NPDC056743 TaxID=3345934 RepID=UPI00366D377A